MNDQDAASRPLFIAALDKVVGRAEGCAALQQEPCHQAMLHHHPENCTNLGGAASTFILQQLTRRWPKYEQSIPLSGSPIAMPSQKLGISDEALPLLAAINSA